MNLAPAATGPLTGRTGTTLFYSDELPATAEAAVLFAAKFPAAAEALLRAKIGREGADGHEPWIMLLEILHLVGDRPAFDDVARTYCATFGLKTPPPWGFPAPVRASGTLELKGTLAAGADIAEILPYARTRSTVAIDMSQVERIDYAFAASLCDVLGVIHDEGKRVILANIADVHATLLRSFSMTARLVLLRRWKAEPREPALGTGAWAPYTAANEAVAAEAA